LKKIESFWRERIQQNVLSKLFSSNFLEQISTSQFILHQHLLAQAKRPKTLWRNLLT